VRRLLYLLIWALSAVAPAHALADAYAAQDGHQIGQYSQVIAPSSSADLMPGQRAQPPPEQLAISTTWRPWPKWVSGNTARQQLTNILLPIAVADYQPGNYVGTLNASAWLNSIGAAPSLAQASGAAQPIILPYSGQKYLANFGVSGNYLSTPSAAANQITGDIDLRVDVALNNWQAANVLVAKRTAVTTQVAYAFYVNGTGLFSLISSVDGTTLRTDYSTVANALTAGQRVIARATRASASGNVNFYYSTDSGATWTQLGTTVAGTAGAIFASTAVVEVGSQFVGTNSNATGKIYGAQIYNGIAGALAVDFNASDWPETTTNGATAVSSTTGETWTLANTGTLLAQIVGSPQLLFDGVGMLMTATYAQNLPIFWIIVGKQITWVTSMPILGNLNFGTPVIRQRNAGTSPQVELVDGTAPFISPTLNTYSIISAAEDSAGNVSIQLNNGTAVTATGGTVNSITGFAVGGDTFHARYFNGQYKEIIALNAIPSAAKLAKIISLLDQIYGVYVQNTDASDWLPSWTAVAANDEEYRLVANGRPRGLCCGR